MAIVKDKSLGFPLWGGSDRPYVTPNRTGAATPYAAVVPLYVGEIYGWKDAAGAEQKLFRAQDMLNTGWVRVTPNLQPAH
jgi:hypothetical protein